MGRPRKIINTTPGTRAVIYIRVSTQEQAKGGHYGPEAQFAACESYITQKKYSVIETTSDMGISGAKTVDARPGLSRALTLCEMRMADVVVCYAQDRLARKAGVFDDIRERAIKNRYRLETARDGQVLTAAENELSADAMSFVASIERKLIAKRLYGGRKERSKIDGRGSGFLPWGYKRSALGGIVIDPEPAYIISELLWLRSNGYTFQQTADWLNEQGFKTRNERDWSPASVQTIERNRNLYMTGRRQWDGIEAIQLWPVIFVERTR